MKFEDILVQSENDYSLAKKFNLEANVVYTTFTSNIKSFKSKKIWRISIRLTSKSDLDNYEENLEGVVEVFRFFDFKRYWSMPAKDRKKEILDILFITLKGLCDKYSLPIDNFYSAYKKTVEHEIKYSGYWNDYQKSTNGKYEGRIFIELDIDISKIEAEIKDIDTGEVKKYLLAEPKPHYMFFDRLLGKSYWNSYGQYCLESKDQRTVLKVKPF